VSDPLEDLLPARPPMNRALVWGAVLCGVGAFVAAGWLSLLLTPGDSGTVELGAGVITLLVAFIVLLTLCMVLGYTAARRRPPADSA
jgi:hypothetical protein